MHWARCFFFFLAIPLFTYASFTHRDCLKCVNARIAEWKQHEELVQRFSNLTLFEREQNIVLLQQAIECCKKGIDHSEYLTGRINKKSSRERHSGYWSEEKNRSEKDKETFQNQIGFLYDLISETHKAIAFERAKALYQESEQKANFAKCKEKECPKFLNNEDEVVSTLYEVAHLYEEAMGSSQKALQKIALYSDEVSEKTLRYAINLYQVASERARTMAASWPKRVYEQKLALEKRQECKKLAMKSPLPAPSKEFHSQEFKKREAKRREHFYLHPPGSFLNNFTPPHFASFPMDGCIAREGNRFTLYQEQFYRFFVPNPQAASHLSIEVHKMGEVIDREEFALPFIGTSVWEQYLTVDGMVWSPDTRLTEKYGLDLRLQFICDPKNPYSLMISARGNSGDCEFVFYLDEKIVHTCAFVLPPPWPLSKLCKSTFNRWNCSLFKHTLPSIRGNFSSASPAFPDYPPLNQLVKELKADPLALASYVQNEIDFYDPFLPQEKGIFLAPSIHRNPLRVHLDKRGSPWEQCQLLVYLLNQAGYQALYAMDGVSSLPREFAERLFLTHFLQDVPVKYPWVLLNDGQEWIPLFPWMKEVQVEEGFDLYSLMPEEIASAERWMEGYLKKNGEGTAGEQFIQAVEQELRRQGLSFADVGIHRNPIKRQFASWSDLPRPFLLTEPTILASLNEKNTLFAEALIEISSRKQVEQKIVDRVRLADFIEPFPIWFSGSKLHVKFNEERELDLEGLDDLIDFKVVYEVPLGSEVIRAQRTLSVRAGTRAALSFHFGGGSPLFVSQIYKQFASAQNEEERQNALLGFVGASYFDRCGQAEEALSSLHKMRPITAMAFGLTKFSPWQETVLPQVDMFWFSAKPPYGPDLRQYQTLSLLNSSSCEHQILQEVFHDDSAISTVKLLQLANQESKRDLIFTTSSVELALELPEAAHQLYFSDLRGVSLKEHLERASAQWETTCYYVGKEGPLHHFAYARMTPGQIESENGSYKEMGTLIFHPMAQYALISNDEQISHGGLGSPLSPFLLSSSAIRNWQLVPQINRYGTSSYSLQIPSRQETIPLFENKKRWDSDIRAAFKSVWNSVADPVDVVTGAFYIDEIDLVLPGPFPLEIRRNYSSQNLQLGLLGVGWKLSLNPFLIEQEDKLYAAEVDGTVIAYSYNKETARWEVFPEDNPDLYNLNCRATNPFHAYIENEILYGPDGSQRIFENGLLETWKNPQGITLKFFYEEENLSRIESSQGSFCGLHYNHEGKISEIYASDGRRISYAYNAKGDLIRVTLPNTAVISYDYDSEHKLIRETKPHGNLLENIYQDGKVIEQRSPMGFGQKMIPTALFDYQENVTTVTDAAGGKTVYKLFDNQIHTIIDPVGHPTFQSWFIDDRHWFDPITEKILNWDLSGGFSRSLKSFTDKRGYNTSYLYDTFGNPVQIHQDDGTQYLTYNERHLCIEEEIFDQKKVTLYDSQFPYLPSSMTIYREGVLLSWMNWEYNQLGQIEKENRSGSVTLFAYDARGFPSQKTELTNTEDPDLITTYVYNQQGKCIEIRSSDAIQKNSYDIMGNQIESQLFSHSDRLLSASETGYNLNHAPLWQRGANRGDVTFFDYDGSGHLKASKHKDAYCFYEYDSRGYLIQEVNPCGYVTDREYDAIGRMISETKEGLSTYFTYEPGGLVASLTSPSGATTSFFYKTNGQLAKERFPDGSCHLILYDGFGRPIRDTFNNLITEITYQGHLVTRSYGDVTEVSEYDARGNLLRFTDGAGYTTESTYDGLNRIKSKISPMGAITTWSYSGDTITTFFPNGEKQVQSHEGGKIVQCCLFDPSGALIAISSLQYDPETGIQELSEGDIITTTWMNFQGLPARVQKGNVVTQYEYDRCGHCIALIDGDGNITRQSFDVWGRLASKELADGSVISYGYDLDSHLIEYHLPNQISWKASYDLMGRKLNEWLESGAHITQEWEYNYANGHLIKSKDPMQRLHFYEYDLYGNLTRETVDGYERLFNYDLRGYLISAEQIDPASCFWSSSQRSKVERTYDGEGRITLEKISINSIPIQLTAQTWTPSGRSLQIKDHKRDFLYQNHQLIQVSTPQTKLDYSYDLSGSLASVTSPFMKTRRCYNESGLPSQSEQETLSWTSFGKLSSYSSPFQSEQFTYTDGGRLHTTNGATYEFSHGVRIKAPDHRVSELDPFGRVISEQLSGIEQGTTYDSLGQVLSQGDTQFEWDPWGRLRKVSSPSITWTACYDPFGRRLQTHQRAGWFTTSVSTYLYDPEEEFQSIGVQIDNQFFWKIYGPKSCDAITDSSNKTAFLFYNTMGHLTSVLSDTIHTLPPTLPYGPQTPSSPTDLLTYAQSLAWHGQSLDPTGFMCLGERYYDPRTGRFLSPDPLGYPPCFDLYAYADGDPINYTDLDGRFASAAYDTVGSYVARPISVRAFNYFSAHNYENTSSTPFTVGAFDLPKGAIGFINGVNNSSAEAMGHARYLSRYVQGAKIQGVYNATHSLVLDVLEAKIVQLGYNTSPVYRLKEQWAEFSNKQEPNAKLLQICHSGGCGILKNALEISPKEIQERIIVLAIAPSVIVPRSLCYKADNYVSRRDFVPHLDRDGMNKYGKELKVLEPHPNAALWDHGFDSPTFSLTIRNYINNYLDSNGR